MIHVTQLIEFFLSLIFTARNEVVAKVMFLLVSVILLTRGGVCLSARWDTTPQEQTPPGADTPREQTHPPGADIPSPRSRHPLPREQTPPPEQTPLKKQTPAYGQ